MVAWNAFLKPTFAKGETWNGSSELTQLAFLGSRVVDRLEDARPNHVAVAIDPDTVRALFAGDLIRYRQFRWEP